MTPNVAEALKIVSDRRPLSRALAEAAFGDLMDGQASEAQKGAILLGIATRGETADEIAGAVAALRRRMRRVATGRSPLLDTCGPGGLGRDLFNLSTAAAVVAAGAGAAVAKHGNRSISSRVGSADVLAASGVRVDLDPIRAGQILDEAGLVFLFAPSFHPAMKELGTVRRELGIRTIFNALGSAGEPGRRDPPAHRRRAAGPDAAARGRARRARQRAGDRLSLRERSRRADSRRGRRSASRCGTAGRGPGGSRRTPSARSPWIWPSSRGATRRRTPRCSRGFSKESREPRREAVLLNVAVALVVEGRAQNVEDGYERARAAIDSGAARGRFEALRAASGAA